jgi:hypothetical protein
MGGMWSDRRTSEILEFNFMILTATASREIFEDALRAARKVGPPAMVEEGLNADLLASVRGRVEKAWDEVSETLNKAFMYGWEKTNEAIDASIGKINELLAAAGEHARELHAWLLDRMREFLRRFVEAMLSLFPGTVTAGGISLSLAQMNLTQKLKLSGSIEANLTALAKLVSEGEMEIACEYKIAPPTGTAVN